MKNNDALFAEKPVSPLFLSIFVHSVCVERSLESSAEISE